MKILRLQSFFLVAGVRIGIWILPYRTVSRLSEKLYANRHRQGADLDQIRLVVEYVNTSGQYIPAATCLTRAVAAKTLLRIYGQTSDLRIGVDKISDSEIEAHAWLEVDGEIIIGEMPDHERYKVMKIASSISEN